MNTISIIQLNLMIKQTLDDNQSFKNISVVGEISNLTFNKSGHCYFSLKENDSNLTYSIQCSIWKSNVHKIQQINAEDGTKVIATGTVSYYAPSGRINFNIVDLKLTGEGELQKIYNQRYKELEAKGWFDLVNKKNLPKLPKTIGIITTDTGAGVHDIVSSIKRRYSLATIYLFPAMVQGELAANDIAQKIGFANNFNIKLDVLIVGRGGGSYEDLWCFNEMPVLQAIYNSEIPIISAIGHEPDWTLADYVADKRAPTPTGAAEIVTPTNDEIKRSLNSLIEKNSSGLQMLINEKSYKLKQVYFDLDEKLSNLNTISQNKVKLKQVYDQNVWFLKNIILKLPSLNTELISYYQSQNKLINLNLEHKLNLFETELKVSRFLNPLSPLDKGFALIYNDQNKITKTSMELTTNDYEIKMKDRKVNVRIEVK